jgi:hypothetical protein
MTDIYARVGIPMPPDPTQDSEPEDKTDPTEGFDESVQAEPSIWEKRAQEERDRDLRFECLKLMAKDYTGKPEGLVRGADVFYKYVKDGLSETPSQD